MTNIVARMTNEIRMTNHERPPQIPVCHCSPRAVVSRIVLPAQGVSKLSPGSLCRCCFLQLRPLPLAMPALRKERRAMASFLVIGLLSLGQRIINLFHGFLDLGVKLALSGAAVAAARQCLAISHQSGEVSLGAARRELGQVKMPLFVIEHA